MLSYKKSKKNLCDNRSDMIAIKKTVFEWFGFIFVMAVTVCLFFSFVFRICEVSVYSENQEKISFDILVCSYRYEPEVFDNVVILSKNGNKYAKIIAVGNQKVKIDLYNNIVSVDNVIIDAENCPSAKDISKKFGKEIIVPDKYALIQYNNCNEKVFETVSYKDILGRADTIIYPVEFWRKNIEDIK